MTGSGTDLVIGRSEGLGVASWHMFFAGAFAGDGSSARADAEGLKKMTPAVVAKHFQVSDANPLTALEGRATLLKSLGDCVAAQPTLVLCDRSRDGHFLLLTRCTPFPPFQGACPALHPRHGAGSADTPDLAQYFPPQNGAAARPGNMVDYLVAQRDASGGKLTIHDLWRVVVYGLADIWPADRLQLDGLNLGDAWKLELAGEETTIVFHKLSQWLTYSLLESLERQGFAFDGAADHMTGLAEYRNGGLIVDMELIVPKDKAVLSTPQPAASATIVEWRALTVSLMDRIAARLRETKGGLSQHELPLAKILEGGTWSAGRRQAAEKRPETRDPPIVTISDGTVF